VRLHVSVTGSYISAEDPSPAASLAVVDVLVKNGVANFERLWEP
jgi:tryptophan synthase alpha subunit